MLVGKGSILEKITKRLWAILNRMKMKQNVSQLVQQHVINHV